MTLDGPFPERFVDLESWAERSGKGLEEARTRFAQFQILRRLGKGRMHEIMVLKGGICLRLLLSSPRATTDVDFSALEGFPLDEAEIKRVFTEAIGPIEPREEIRLAVHSVHKNPSRADATFPTYEIKIAYCIKGDKYFHRFPGSLAFGHYAHIVSVEVSVKEEVCEWSTIKLDAQGSKLSRSTLEDVIAEKARALLQQVTRNRTRRQDLHDIAWVWKFHRGNINLDKVAVFFAKKCRARSIEPARSSFNEDVRIRAMSEYELLFDDLSDPDYIPFDEAWRLLGEFLMALKLPD